MRRSLPVLLAFLLSLRAAVAFSPDQMPKEFDARVLTQAEKRFLQVSLAFLGHYNGLIDGAWGQGSQRALERYNLAEGRTPFVSNADVLFLAVEGVTALETHGWVRQYNSGLDMSFLVPTIGLTARDGSEAFANFDVVGTSIGYSLTIGDEGQVVRLHDYTAAEAVIEPYLVRKPGLWITSARTASGRSLYTRSDHRRGGWSTIMVSASDTDAGALAAISGSIAPGYAPDVGISPGVLETGIGARAADPPEEQAGQGASFGTGFIVSAQGHVLTNEHVVERCRSITVEGSTAELVASDPTFDLALLSVPALVGASPASFAEAPARLNSDVTVAGYPLSDLLGGLNVTRGGVTSLKGIGGDGIRMQISAPVQPGNSGGPVVNGAGQVVGVVVAKLDAAAVARVYDDIPQNVNFAVRGEIAKLFLAQNGVDPVIGGPAGPLAPEAIADLAQGFTRLVTCH
jgi:S1-C subfamily serine protease